MAKLRAPGLQPGEDKFRELILYIADRSEGDEWFGATKLNKILFYADFTAFLRTGESITGQAYQKLQHGPVPRRLLPVRNEMERKGDCRLREQIVAGEKTQHRLIAMRDPDLAFFTAQEIAIVDEVIVHLRRHTGADASELSHSFIGYQLAEMNEEIPYHTVYLHQCQALNEDDEEFAKNL